MPIKVKCSCGQSFSANDKLAGKTVKCPKCGQPISIPTLQDEEGAVAKLLEEAGLSAYAADMRRCPECNGEMKDEAIICIQCGYNEKLGRKMKTRMVVGDSDTYGEERESLGHSMLDDAADRMQEDKQQQIDLTKGLPWWIYLVVLIGIVVLAIAMTFLPKDNVMLVSVMVLIGGLYLASLYCGIRLIIIAFQENTTCGLLYLFLPFYALYYCITRWERCGTYFMIQFAIGFVVGLAQALLLPLVAGD